MADKTQFLKQIEADILKDNICLELAESATKLVFGDGSIDSEIVFIGEAPGKNEDEQGKPFVGAAGKFLDEMISSIGMKRSNVYITNIVKYRPPDNRDPFPEEKTAFLPYLVRQLEVIKPKLIVTLGRHSTEVFLPGLKISQVHGQPKRIRINLNRGKVDQLTDPDSSQDGLVLVILPLFHPAAALYNGGMRETLISDFEKIPRTLELINGSKINSF